MPTISLTDGRSLSYAEYGDPQGKPVFFFHGTPGSRFFHPEDEITRRFGVRLITTDRPGYGDSTFQPRRRLLDWAVDVAQLADSLGIDSFAVAGHSGGGPHALACGYALPGRVLRAATLSGAGPVGAPGITRDMTALNRLGFKFGHLLPWTIFRILVRTLYHQRAVDPARAIDNETGKRPPADDAVIAMQGVREMCIQSEEEAFRPGITGMSWDALLITRPWGFMLEEIKVPVHIWHGSADRSTTVAMAKFMGGKIAGSRTTILPDAGHMLLIPYWQAILEDLIV